MNISVQKIDQLLNAPKQIVRKATVEDVIFIKNELFSILNENSNENDSLYIRSLINEMHYLNISVELDTDQSIIYYYEPLKKYAKKVKLNEAGWIEIEK